VQFSEIVAAVLDRLSIASSDTVKVTQVKAAINRARDRLVLDERLLITQANLTYTAGTDSLTLPADVMGIVSISSGSYVLEPMTYNELADYRVRGTASEFSGPLVYLREGIGTNVEVWPTPAETATVTKGLVYVPQPTELSADADTPSEIPRAYHDLLVEMAVIRVAQNEEAFDIAESARRNVHGTPGTTDQGLLADFRAFAKRQSGYGSTRVWPRGYV
jgi:hypothetical protein